MHEFGTIESVVIENVAIESLLVENVVIKNIDVDIERFLLKVAIKNVAIIKSLKLKCCY